MAKLMTQLMSDEAGFILSAELVLVSTIATLPMIVGLAEIANAVNQVLENVASEHGAVNQSHRYSGLEDHKRDSSGSLFDNQVDDCDSQFDIVCNRQP